MTEIQITLKRTRIEQRLRRFLKYKSPFLDSDPSRQSSQRNRNGNVERRLAQVVSLGLPKFTEPFAPEAVPLERYALVSHSDDPFHVMSIDSQNRVRRLPPSMLDRLFSNESVVLDSHRGWADHVTRVFGFAE